MVKHLVCLRICCLYVDDVFEKMYGFFSAIWWNMCDSMRKCWQMSCWVSGADVDVEFTHDGWVDV